MKGREKWEPESKRERYIRRKSVSHKLHMKTSVKVHQILFHDTKKTKDTTLYTLSITIENKFDHPLSALL